MDNDNIKLLPLEVDAYVAYMDDDELKRLADAISSKMMFEISTYRLAVLQARKQRADMEMQQRINAAIKLSKI